MSTAAAPAIRASSLAPAGPAPDPGEPQRQDEPRANILIVDDLAEKHLVFRTILAELGENIVSARSGREALAQVLDNEFAVILLDVNMPDIDGLETAGLIRRHKRSAQTPIVFITAYVDELQAKRGYALGAVDYIPSPVVPEVLRSKVRVFVELFRMNRQLRLRAAEREALARSEAARAAAELAVERADFLAEASRRLSQSLDPAQTEAALLQVCVPRLADRALLFMAAADGGIRLARAHPEGPVDAQVQEGMEPVLREVIAQHRPACWRSGEGAALLLPLQAPGQESAHAVLALVGRQGQFDIHRTALAREVSSRAVIAMDNARLYDAVQQADRRKNEFLAMLAHELRNPLAPIRNAVHLLQAEEVPARTLHWARDVISRQADHMARLIDDLLDVSRIVQGKVAVRPEPLDLATLVDRSVEASAPRLAARQQQLQLSLPPEPVHLRGDLVRLAQVLSNLLNNAAKFSPAGSRIELNARVEGPMLRIGVRDEGAGIEPSFLPHIFELFVQADQSLDRSQGGLGIGLTLVRHLVELHGGRVEAFSEGPGRGSEVVVWLPVTLPVPATTERPPPDATVPSLASPGLPPAAHATRVLVVDDLAASAESMRMLLEMEGCSVRVASEGESALRIAQEFQPQVVLLDIGLPGMNGFEVARHLRSSPVTRDVLLIALTGYGEAESRHRSAEAGFDVHLVKPADINQLLALVTEPNASQARKG